jgi:hypothetical protein
MVLIFSKSALSSLSFRTTWRDCRFYREGTWLAGGSRFGLWLSLGSVCRGIMTGIAASIGRNNGQGWRAIACLILLAFTLQSYITQTHIHNTSPTSISKTFSKSHSKAPIDNSPIDCPFCQAIAHDGSFFLAAMPIFHLSATWTESAVFRFCERLNAGTAAHNWQSRAPPQH